MVKNKIYQKLYGGFQKTYPQESNQTAQLRTERLCDYATSGQLGEGGGGVAWTLTSTKGVIKSWLGGQGC